MIKKYKITVVIEGKPQECESEMRGLEENFKESAAEQSGDGIKVLNFEWKEIEEIK